MGYKILDDGSQFTWSDDADLNEIRRQIKEKNLAIKLEKDQANYLNSDKYQPATELEQEDIGTWGAAGRGALHGLVSIPTETLSTVGYGLQLAGEEEMGQDLVTTAQSIQEMYAPDITGLGLAAELPKALVQFGVPGMAILKATKGIRKGAGLIPLAAGEFTVASPDMETFGDSFVGGGPTKTRELQYLDGQEKAYAALENKGKTALEGAAVAIGAPFAFAKAAQIGLPLVSKTAALPVVGDVIRGSFSAAKEAGEVIGKAVDGVLKESPFWDKAAGLFRYRGMLPTKEMAEIRDARSLEFASLLQANKIALDDAQQSLDFVFKKGEANGLTAKDIMDAWDTAVFPTDELFQVGKDEGKAALARGALDTKQQEALQVLVEADKAFGLTAKNLTANSKVEKIKSDYSLFRSAKRARDSIDAYSKAIQKHPELLPKGAVDTIEGQLGLYGTRQYRAFLEKNYVPPKALEDKAIDSIIEANRKNGKSISREEARTALNELIQKPGFLNSTLNPKNLIEDSVLDKMNDGILKGRTLNSKAIREYLGEYTGKEYITPGQVRSVDVRKADLTVKLNETLKRQAGIISKGNFLKYLDEYNKTLPAGSKVFLDELPPGQAGLQGEQQYVHLKSSFYGPLEGKYVRQDYLNALDKDSWQPTGLIGSGYAFFLGLKGLSQLGKTAYNPVGQIRNVTSAMGFAIANGNVPNGQTMSESFSLVAKSIKNEFGKDATGKAMFEKYSRLGVVGQQAQLGELNSLIDEAASAASGVGKIFGSKGIQAYQNSIMTKLYQGGDDVWRIFNFKTESEKLRSIIAASEMKGNPFIMKANSPVQRKIVAENGLDPNRFDVTQLPNTQQAKERGISFDDFIDEEAAFITRDVVPNYERVPEVINLIRRLPLGNFIAYPAEILRTSANILGRSITELSSENALMRARGMERLLGYSSITVGIPSGITAMGIMSTGTTEEQLDAYRRSGAAPWDRNATLVPIKTDKDGNVEEVVNLSYTMPYDFMITPFAAVQNAVDNGVRSEKELNKIAWDATLGEGGIYDEFFRPFMGQSMITQRITDVLAGQTPTGASIGPGEDASYQDKFYAGFAHIFNGLVPTISPAELNLDVRPWEVGKITPTDAPAGAKDFYGISRALNVKDLPTSVLVESGLVDPRYRVSKGKQLDFYGEMFEAMTGVKSIKLDMERSLKYKALDLGQRINSAGEGLRKLARTKEYRTPEEFAYNYEKLVERQRKLAAELKVAIDDAKYLGVSSMDINKIMSDNNVPRWRSIVRGKFLPSMPSPGLYIKQKEIGDKQDKIRNIVPLSQMRRVFGEAKASELPSAPVLPPPVPTPDLRLFPSKSQASSPPLAPLSAEQTLRQQEMRKLLGID